MSGGDKILSENYFQHADHFMRILNDQEIYKKTKLNNIMESEENNSVADNSENHELKIKENDSAIEKKI